MESQLRGICKLCGIDRELRNSHAIPDSIFNVIFKENSGKAILLTVDGRKIDYTSDSLDTKQLCDICEKKLNHSYEKYSINLLRNSYRNVSKESEGINFSEVDVEKFMKFILAIYWRAAVSEHESYRGAVMHEELLYKNGAEKLRLCLLENSKIPASLFSVKIRRLRDLSGSFSLQTLKNLIVTPFHRPYGKDEKVSVNFVIEGFYISVIMPALSDKERRKDVVLYAKGNQFTAGYVDALSIPELKETIRVMGLKIRMGHSNVGS
jgi:hypothetical protein